MRASPRTRPAKAHDIGIYDLIPGSRLLRNRQNHRQEILGTMRELAGAHTDMILALLAPQQFMLVLGMACRADSRSSSSFITTAVRWVRTDTS